MSDTELLMSGQVAALAEVNRVTVHQWAKDGKLPVAQVVNGVRLFDRATVEAFIANRKAVTQ